MADEDTSRLCVQIVQDHFGSTPARVASELLGRGRLRLAHIVRSTHIKPRAVAHAILILIQQNILWHAESAIEGEIFEVNAEEILARLRFGRYIATAHDVYGSPAEEIISHILDNGKVRSGDIVPALTDKNDRKSHALYTSALISLLKSRYLKPTNEAMQISPRDRLIRFQEAAEKAKHAEPGSKKGPLAAKELLQVKELAAQRLQEEIEAVESGGFKRKAKDTKETLHSRSSKRQKVDEDVLDEDVYLRVNYVKFNIHIRSQLIESATDQRYNESASLVIGATLNAALQNEYELSSIRSEPISVHTILKHLPAEPPLVGIALRRARTAEPSSSMQGAYVKEYVNILCAADNPTEAGKAAAFLSFSGGAGTGGGGKKVTIEYETIGRKLRLLVLENFVRERWGDQAMRVCRIMLDKGKMDEKQISKIAMMSKKDVQPLLTHLSRASLISLQEVPRSTDRSASRTIYLWYIDLAKTYSVILISLYKSLGNILVRKRGEQDKIRSILEKSERSDVRGDSSLLARGEREALAQYEEKRMRLSVLERRVEECVFVMRDLAPDGYVGEGGGR